MTSSTLKLSGARLLRPLLTVLAIVVCFQDFAAGDDSVQLQLDNAAGGIASRASAKPYPRLAAEFEPARVLLLGVSDWQPHHREILIEIATKSADHVNIMVLCNDTWQIKQTTQWLLEADQDFANLYFCEIPLDTVWLRDFGPIFGQTSDGAMALDFYYEGTRPKDDGMPAVWSRRSGTQHVAVPWTVQGGNLIFNGQGLALATNRIFEDNYIRFNGPHHVPNAEYERRKMVVDQFVMSCNLSQLVILEPLQSESTKHVDMFATFLSAEDVLVAELDPASDPVNAAILDRNVARLAKVQVGDRPLRVHRIRIPTRDQMSWSAYTNAIIADDLILMPVFGTDPPELIEQAKQKYRSLMPRHTVETIDMSSMKQLQGELHCLSRHVPAFAPLPDRIYPYANSVQAYFPEKLK